MLPKIQYPLFEIMIPSLNKEVNFRPFLVKEEKILLMAQQSDDEKDKVKAIKQVVNNCCVDESISVDALTLVDLEYLFLRLRALSINNIVEVVYVDKEDSKEYKFEIDLNKVKVTKKKNVKPKIMITKEHGLVLTQPTAAMIDDIKKFNTDDDMINFFLQKCIVEIFDGDTVYPIKEQTDADLKEFIDSLDIKTFGKIREFFESAPKLEYIIEYENSLGSKRKIVLDSLKDFFTLG